MEDDGIIVNFDVPTEISLINVPKFTGGRWTDRVKAKRIAKARAKKQLREKAAGARIQENTAASCSGADALNRTKREQERQSTTQVRPLKRKRDLQDDNEGRAHSGTRSKVGGAEAAPREQFVSSLFTRNPKSRAVTNTEGDKAAIAGEEDTSTTTPSNAPLSDESATFVNLGLSPVLASHLTTKLSLRAPTAIQRAAIPELLTNDSDAFIQAETGSGKTLTYILPILNRIMKLTLPTNTKSDAEAVHRDSGLFAIILAPTRELSRQIMVVLSTLIHCKNGPHWIVPGYVIGGEKRKAEKARLRKGLNILVATPGRLLDHLEHTESLDISKVKWVVMDEGDRLMELGFEETISKILELLEKKKARKPAKVGKEPVVMEGILPKRRVAILCSATMKANVQRLGDMSLTEALFIKAENIEMNGAAGNETAEVNAEEKFLAPAQLKQSYIVVPAKQRLVALYAILKRTFIRQMAHLKVIVFFSCSDSVDFHFEIFSRELLQSVEGEKKQENKPESSNSSSKTETEPSCSKPQHTRSSSSSNSSYKEETKANPACHSSPQIHSQLLLHKLHGSLPQPIRTITLSSFTHTKQPAVLFCTDVASRGLDLPNIDLVVQLDPPFSKDDHLHRIGRTARAGRGGRAVIFLLPGPEEGYVEQVLKKGVREGQVVRKNVEELLEKGFSDPASVRNSQTKGKKIDEKRSWENKATAWQLSVEQYILANKAIHDLAKRAWGSHIRAYTTHTSNEKDMFNLKVLHSGHLAKSFGLREKPGDIQVPSTGAKDTSRKVDRKRGRGAEWNKRVWDANDEMEKGGNRNSVNYAARKMRELAQKMMVKGATGLGGEFNIG